MRAPVVLLVSAIVVVATAMIENVEGNDPPAATASASASASASALASALEELWLQEAEELQRQAEKMAEEKRQLKKVKVKVKEEELHQQEEVKKLRQARRQARRREKGSSKKNSDGVTKPGSLNPFGLLVAVFRTLKYWMSIGRHITGWLISGQDWEFSGWVSEQASDNVLAAENDSTDESTSGDETSDDEATEKYKATAKKYKARPAKKYKATAKKYKAIAKKYEAIAKNEANPAYFLNETLVNETLGCYGQKPRSVWIAAGLSSLPMLFIAAATLILWSLKKQKKAGLKGVSRSNTNHVKRTSIN